MQESNTYNTRNGPFRHARLLETLKKMMFSEKSRILVSGEDQRISWMSSATNRIPGRQDALCSAATD